MHRLLQRQIKKHLRGLCPTEQIEPFLAAVDAAYHQADEDRALLERSIELSSNELRLQNSALEARLDELQSTRDKLERSYSLLRSTLDSTEDAIVVVGSDNRVRAHNRQFAGLWSAERPASLVGTSYRPLLRQFLKRVVNRDEMLLRLRELQASEEHKGQLLLELVGRQFFELTSIPQRQGGRVVGRVFSLHDVTAKRTDEEIIRHQAYHDALTDLPNRLLMNDRLRHAIQLARRSGKGVAVLFLDLDHFKSVNDRLGHDVGDKLLIEVSGRLRGCLRESDTICRLGGDEFTIILENMPDDQAWKGVASKLIDRLAEPFDIAGNEIWISTSVGVSQFPRDAQTAEDLLRHADMAMYEAKQLGRSRYSEFNLILQHQTDRKADIEFELRNAIARHEFQLVYQPKYELGSLRVAGFECLLRWENRKLGKVSPEEFIPVAEQCGFIVPIGQWVMAEACRQLGVWRASGFDDVSVAVNLSVQQFQHPGLLQDIRRNLEDHAVPPSAIELEITESSVMVDVEQVTKLLTTLRKVGVALAIDDFGAGYSSMSYLKNLPVDFLKIDREFVREIATARDDAAIVASMITLGHNLGLGVVAEGVEDQAGLEVLRRLECDFVQGFLLCRPVPAVEATALLQDATN